MSKPLTALADQLADAPVLPESPTVVDVTTRLPLNPSMDVQRKFVGASFGAAYKEAAAFVNQARTWRAELGLPTDRRNVVLDFGSGWGRISRMLLEDQAPTDLYCLDVDPSMTALIQTTLPGVNAMTGTPLPPSVLGDGVVTEAFAFSVFSHLSEAAHAAWATEFGRIVAPGGLVYITTLEKDFLRQVRNCQKAVQRGSAEPFHQHLAKLIPDLPAADRAFENGEFIYCDAGADGPRTGDFYGWAAVPRSWMEQHWGAAGFTIKHWVPTGKLFGQAMIGLQRQPDGVVPVHAASGSTGRPEGKRRWGRR